MAEKMEIPDFGKNTYERIIAGDDDQGYMIPDFKEMGNTKELKNIQKEFESYQNQSLFNRLSPKQFNQVVESMNLYINKLSQKEVELARKQDELERKQDELNQEVSNLHEEKKEVEESKKQALETIRIFKEKEPTLRDTSIPDAAVVRDKLVISELDDIREQVKVLKEREKDIIDNTDYNVQITNEEKLARKKRTSQRRKEKNLLKARLLGIVAAYRDLLPDDQLNYLTVNDKSFSSFLKEELVKIAKETEPSEKNWYKTENKNYFLTWISEDVYDSVTDGYISIAKNKVVNSYAGKAYKTAAYLPFEFEAESTDDRSTGFNVVKGIFMGEERTLDLKGKNANLTRSIENMSDKPLVEQSIVDTVNEFDYPYYDVEKHNKTL